MFYAPKSFVSSEPYFIEGMWVEKKGAAFPMEKRKRGGSFERKTVE